MDILMAGAGRGTIRFPEEIFPVEGFCCVHDDPAVRVLALGGGEGAALVAMELVMLGDGAIDQIRTIVSEICGIKKEHVLVHVTHAISTPHDPMMMPPFARVEGAEEKSELYQKAVLEAVTEAAKMAAGSRCPVSIGSAEGLCRVNTNRDVNTCAGWWIGESGDEPVNQKMTVIELKNEKDKPTAFLIHYALKTCALDNSEQDKNTRQISSDVAGKACRIMEDTYGVPCFFLMSAAANHVPRHTAWFDEVLPDGNIKTIDKGVEYGLKLVEEFGTEMARDAAAIAEKITVFENQANTRVLHTAFEWPGVGRMEKKPSKDPVYPPGRGPRDVDVWALTVGEYAFVCGKAEMNQPTQQDIEARSPYPHTVFMTMVNGGMKYMPEASAYDRFTWEAQSTFVAKGAAEKFADTAVNLLVDNPVTAAEDKEAGSHTQMKKKTYLYVGNWSFEANPEKGKGISIFTYEPETGDLELMETICPEVAGGQLCLNAERGILYVNDECGNRRGEIGGGGYIMAFKIDPATGRLSLMNRKDSLSPEPSYVCLDKSEKYLVTCHCADPWHVTKIVKNEDGSFTNEVLFDDTALVMFAVNEDGSLGEVCDVAITPGTGGKGEHSRVNVDPVSGHIQLVQVVSRLHSVVASPRGDVLAVCDKGMDKVYTFKIDRENGKLIQTDEWSAPEVACFPRYAAFHPEKPVLYVNNENYALLNSFHYDEGTGSIERFHSVYLLPEDPGMVDGKPVGAQDIMVHPNGKVLYCTLCGLNLIVVCRLDEKGVPTPYQRIYSRGNLPRGIALSPDRRFLFSGNMVSGDITVFSVDEEGLLTDTGRTVAAVSPSALRFYTPD